MSTSPKQYTSNNKPACFFFPIAVATGNERYQMWGNMHHRQQDNNGFTRQQWFYLDVKHAQQHVFAVFVQDQRRAFGQSLVLLSKINRTNPSKMSDITPDLKIKRIKQYRNEQATTINTHRQLRQITMQGSHVRDGFSAVGGATGGGGDVLRGVLGRWWYGIGSSSHGGATCGGGPTGGKLQKHCFVVGRATGGALNLGGGRDGRIFDGATGGGGTTGGGAGRSPSTPGDAVVFVKMFAVFRQKIGAFDAVEIVDHTDFIGGEFGFACFGRGAGRGHGLVGHAGRCTAKKGPSLLRGQW